MKTLSLARPKLQDFEIDAEHGFLPATDPLQKLPNEFTAWEQTASEIPKLLVADRIGHIVRDLPMLDSAQLDTRAEAERAMLLLSYLGHAVVFGGPETQCHVPPSIAIPWVKVAGRLGRPPVLSYSSHALYNWRRFDPSLPIQLDNIARLQNFCGGTDEDWFVLVHVEIEASAAPALNAALSAQAALGAGDRAAVTECLLLIASTVRAMLAILRRMPEKCDPYIYYNRVRQFIFGWMDNPALPQGVFYDGATEYNGSPRKFRGETGAQSSIIPSIDALCGIDYANDPLGNHLRELRAYMPPSHRRFIEQLESGPQLRTFVVEQRGRPLIEAYNHCIETLRDFRRQHLEYAGLYIHSQCQRNTANPTEVGTGGTPFMKYLNAHCQSLDHYMVHGLQ